MSLTLCDIFHRVLVINNEQNPAEIINFPDVSKNQPNNPVLTSSVLREITSSLSQETFSDNRQVKIGRVH